MKEDVNTLEAQENRIESHGKDHKRVPQNDVHHYLESVLGQKINSNITWIQTRHVEHTPLDNIEGLSGVGNTERINNIRRINKYFEYINREMETGSYLIAAVETKESRKERLYDKYPGIIQKPYFVLDFILKRVFPKWKPTRSIYFYITKGRNRVLSLSETLGRLVSCGYKVVDYKKIHYTTWIVARKVKEPFYDLEPTYSALIRLQRVGKNGDLINVYKLRTMHPYSEYLQEYIYEKNDLDEGGKFKRDFRNTSYGKFFRKYWLDEFPMFINLFKGELKLVGVRPLSKQYYSLYPADLQEQRIQAKPGLIPPYYADMPEDIEEIHESERRYLASYFDKPVRTDIRYFFKIMYNIIFKGARSS